MQTPITGIVTSDSSKICFYEEDFVFTFMSTETERTVIEPKEEFIFGEMFNGNKIAIYAKNTNVSVRRQGRLQTDSYIISKTNTYEQDITYYDAIIFIGGTLNKLAMPQGVKHEVLDDGAEVFRYNDDSRIYNFFIEDCECKVTVFSSSCTSFGIEGISLNNDKVNLMLEFSEKQPLVRVYEHIAKVNELLAFMTFRRNVGTSEIKLLQHNKMFNGELMDFAEVFIKQDTKYTKKIVIQNIGFDDLGESVEKLLTVIFNSKDDKPGYVLGFIPEKDNDVGIMNNFKIREICSALECELEFVKDINSAEEANLQELIETIKGNIKSHKKGSTALSSKTYSLIFSSINHWSLSASDRIIQLYHRHEQEMEILNPTEKRISDEMICDFVKYRNKITHGFCRILNEDVAVTAHILAGLVYCCLLERIGIDKEKIIEWCRMKILR